MTNHTHISLALRRETATLIAMDYDDIADKFAPASEAMPGNIYYERPATMALLPPLEGLEILDAGCGSGFYVDYCSRAGAKVVGYDPSLGMIEHARRRLGEAAELHHCTTAELADRLAGRQFDLILSNLVLHYVRDLKSELRMLAGFLRPGAKMIVSMKHPVAFIFTKAIEKNGYRWRGRVEANWGGMKMASVYRPLGDITAAISGAGLLIEKLEEPLPDPKMADAAPKDYKLARYLPLLLHMVLRK